MRQRRKSFFPEIYSPVETGELDLDDAVLLVLEDEVRVLPTYTKLRKCSIHIRM